MKKIALTLLLAMGAMSCAEATIWDTVTSLFGGGAKKNTPTIKVLLGHDLDYANLEVAGRYTLYDPYKNYRIGTRFIGKSLPIESMLGGLRWGEEFPGVYQLKIVPDDASTVTLVDGTEYKGVIYVYDIGGAISIVNEVDIEEFVTSVMNCRCARPYSPETLAAVAIAYRTNAYFKAKNTQNPYWQVDAAQVGYQGVATSKRNDSVAGAVAATQYMVMSLTGIYEAQITPFQAPVFFQGDLEAEEAVSQALSIDEAEKMAQEGLNAARILAKAFPKSTIELGYPTVENVARSVAKGRVATDRPLTR